MKQVLLFIIMLGFASVLSINASQGGPDKFIGAWNISVPDSPIPEYSNPKLVFVREDNVLKGSMGINDYLRMDLEDLVIKGRKASFAIYIQGEKIAIDLKRKGNTLTGTASYSQGILTVTGTRQ